MQSHPIYRSVCIVNPARSPALAALLVRIVSLRLVTKTLAPMRGLCGGPAVGLRRSSGATDPAGRACSVYATAWRKPSFMFYELADLLSRIQEVSHRQNMTNVRLSRSRVIYSLNDCEVTVMGHGVVGNCHFLSPSNRIRRIPSSLTEPIKESKIH